MIPFDGLIIEDEVVCSCLERKTINRRQFLRLIPR
jgi:hypothetical protein